jgi:acyl dehydratase
MTDVRELSSPPNMALLYAKAVPPSLPLVGSLPVVGRRASEVPDVELVLPDVSIDREHLAAFDRVCGFALGDTVPPTYPHMLAFPMHLAVMTDGSFPFAPVGLVHIYNRIVQHRPIRATETLTLRVRPKPLQPHRRGRTFSIDTSAHVGDELVWEESSVNLHRDSHGSSDAPREPEPPEAPTAAEWSLPGDLGRRFAAVSGDRNPIHMHPLAARLFGFPRAIAHGMWTLSRCLAALSPLPEACEVEARFRKPLLLPGKVEFGEERSGNAVAFVVRSAGKGSVHLDGSLA